MKTETDISLILSGVRALLGAVTPSLRSASIQMDESKIVFKCVFDESATEDDFELISVVASEIISDFPNCDLEEIFLKILPPESTTPLKNLLYLRHEGNYWR